MGRVVAGVAAAARDAKAQATRQTVTAKRAGVVIPRWYQPTRDVARAVARVMAQDGASPRGLQRRFRRGFRGGGGVEGAAQRQRLEPLLPRRDLAVAANDVGAVDAGAVGDRGVVAERVEQD